jgi:tRNA pseudouridine55 synthase
MSERGSRLTLHGILVIDKPAGWTSHDVVAWVRRWAGERKVGHAGTLDPAATGVLPVALNDGTKVLEFLSDAHKAYVAEITFGISTDSADIDGTVTQFCAPAFADADLEPALERFRGRVRQRPPMHSAVKVAGRRAYELARAGQSVELDEREVTVFSLDVLDWTSPVLTLNVACSKGTYIRSIARDLGEVLGCGAYLSNLVRTRSGPFGLADAWPIHELADLSPADEWATIAIHPDQGVAEWPAAILGAPHATDWGYGRTIPAQGRPAPSSRSRIYDSGGAWLGLASISEDRARWMPLRVIGKDQ